MPTSLAVSTAWWIQSSPSRHVLRVASASSRLGEFGIEHDLPVTEAAFFRPGKRYEIAGVLGGKVNFGQKQSAL